MSELVADIEVYPNFFLVLFKNIETGEVIRFQQSPGVKLDIDGLHAVMQNNLTVWFNGNTYDIPMLQAALNGMSTDELFRASMQLIVLGMSVKEFRNTYGLKKSTYDAIDLIEVCPLSASLKIYGGRLHCKKMQSLPIHPETTIDKKTANLLYRYCINDLDVTILLYKELKQQIELRCQLSEEYGQDLRSRSDAQIAEHVLTAEIEKLSGRKIKRPEVEPGTTYKYKVPDYISYKHPELKKMLSMVKKASFTIDDDGKMIMPKELKNFSVNINGSQYRMGIGGLHSSESCVKHLSDDDYVLLDRDVASYYPSIILTLGLYPKHMGKEFLTVYKSIVDRRLAAKKSGNKVVADSLKITINGSFGKLGCKWSNLYSPDLLIQVTLTGQLALLMLIERIEAVGIEVVSGNTDGIVIKCPRSCQDVLGRIVSEWERVTSFQTEETRYSALYSRDVNNYYAIKEKGVKTKGAYAIGGLSKNPDKTICVKAVTELLTKGTPLAETIRGCQDIRDFLIVRKVTDGADYADENLGKSVRFYYGTKSSGCMTVGNKKVPKTDGCVPCMELPDVLPDDIDYGKYIIEAERILSDIGFSQLTLF